MSRNNNNNGMHYVRYRSYNDINIDPIQESIWEFLYEKAYKKSCDEKIHRQKLQQEENNVNEKKNVNQESKNNKSEQNNDFLAYCRSLGLDDNEAADDIYDYEEFLVNEQSEFLMDYLITRIIAIAIYQKRDVIELMHEAEEKLNALVLPVNDDVNHIGVGDYTLYYLTIMNQLLELCPGELFDLNAYVTRKTNGKCKQMDQLVLGAYVTDQILFNSNSQLNNIGIFDNRRELTFIFSCDDSVLTGKSESVIFLLFSRRETRFQRFERSRYSYSVSLLFDATNSCKLEYFTFSRPYLLCEMNGDQDRYNEDAKNSIECMFDCLIHKYSLELDETNRKLKKY